MLAMLKDSNKYSYFNHGVSLILALSPILQTYGWGPFDFTFIGTCFLFIWGAIFNTSSRTPIPTYLNIYLWYYLFTFIVGGISVGNIELPLGWMKIFLTFWIFFNYVKIGIFCKYYIFISYISIGYFLIQYVLWEYFGIHISGIIDQIPLTLDMDEYDYRRFINSEGTRLCSFFSEPALFAQYLLPLSVLTIFNKGDKNKYIKCAIILATFLLLKSGNAIFILSIVIACYIIHSLMQTFSLKRLAGVIAIFVLISFGSIYYSQSEIGESLIERQSEFEVSETYTSGFLRVYRGYYVYESLDIWEQVFGANNTVLMENAIRHCKIPYLFGDQDYYFNTVQNILIKTGIVGVILFVIFLVETFRKANPVGKTILIGLTILSFIASMYLSYIMLLYLIFSVKLTVIRNEKGRYINYSYRH